MFFLYVKNGFIKKIQTDMRKNTKLVVYVRVYDEFFRKKNPRKKFLSP